MPVKLTSHRLELGLSSLARHLRALGAHAIVIPSQLVSEESPNLASGSATVITGYGVNTTTLQTIRREDYPATFVGSPTRGVRGPLPDGRMASTFNGSSQYITVPGMVSAHGAMVTSYSPLAGRTGPYSLVVLFKGGIAGEPLLCRSVVGKYGLFTDAFGGGIDTRASAGATFPNASDPSNWVLLVATNGHGVTATVWKNGVSQTLTGTVGGKFELPDADQGTLYVGRDGVGGDFFTGTIALAAFIPREVSQADVDALYAATQWTDVGPAGSDDVLSTSPITWETGLPGDGPDDLVARAGSLAFSLNNAQDNSAGLLGYYSPGHANCRSGFSGSIPVRVSLTYGGQTYYKFRGRVSSIQPTAGQYGARDTRVTAFDWFKEAAASPMASIPTETNLRADEGLELLLDGMAQPPAFIEFDQGIDTFPYLFDAAPSGTTPVLAEANRIVQSERGGLYHVGDTVGGGTVRFENRHRRALIDGTFAALLDNAMYELDAARDRDAILTAVTVIIHPRRVDAAATTVLYSLQGVTPRIGPGERIRWAAQYSDPDSPSVSVGATNLVAPAAGVDYVMNSAEDGSGSDATASCTVTFEHGGIRGFFIITNTSTADVFVRTLQVRGKGIYQYADLECRSEDVGKLDDYGENHAQLDMPYQSDPNVGQGIADQVQNVWSQEITGISRLSFVANESDALMLAALRVEPGDRVGIREAVTGVTDVVDGANVGYFVQRVRYSLEAAGILRVTWTLAPADRERFWILDEVGSSELDETTRLAYA